MARSGLLRVAALVLAACAGVPFAVRSARADSCQVLRYTFQPDCLRETADGPCTQVFYRYDATLKTNVVDRMDLGPQIAVWIESADRTSFIDTLMVTNMVAARGIGNRPGLSNFVSSPKFPYGKRQMALPIWAHARGKLYPTVIFQDINEERIGFHESVSSPDPYYCRPMRSEDIVDAITCPSPIFNSSKGRFDHSLPQSFYPPRNDLGSDVTGFISRDCDTPGGALNTCAVSAASYADLNDLDAVAAATPPYGHVYEAFWYVPPALTAGNYAVWLEVNKEFDRNSFHMHPSTQDVGLAGYGLSGNFGQPSVVYRVPIAIDGSSAAVGTVTQIEGYSDWTGATGLVSPRDSTISAEPGSGEGRLLEIDGPGGMARAHVTLEPCVCDPPPPGPRGVTFLPVGPTDVGASKVNLSFTQGPANGSPVFKYEIRYLATDGVTMTPDEFAQATAGPQVRPAQAGAMASFTLENLKPATHYLVGVRVEGPCKVQSEIAFMDFLTPGMKFTQLSGCFIATAAYGSEMEPEVAALRSVRDQLRPQSGIFAAAVELYYRSGPAAAAVISRSETARTLARQLLAPAAGLAELAEFAQAQRLADPNPAPGVRPHP